VVKSVALFVGLLLAASSAIADTTAVYQTRLKPALFTMTVEIADDGSIRYQMSRGRTYGLVLGTADYFVDLSGREPVVDRAEDLLTAQKESMAEFMQFRQHNEGITGPQLVAIGTVTINGRPGRAYGYKPEPKGATPAPVVVFNDKPDDPLGKITTREGTDSDRERMMAGTVIVISDDPDLSQLGKAMSGQFSKSIEMLATMVGNSPAMFKQMQDILKTGAPLSFAGMELLSVNHRPIDPNRFKLPAAVETLDQIRDRMKPLPPPPTATVPKP
jgi:hypothetical protein